jgi:hypothetical protein
MAGNARFHNKWHRRGHHSIVSEGYPDSATDPIASPDEPFIGPFVLRDSLSAGGDVTFNSNVFIHGDATILGSLTALGDTTVLETHVTATSALSVINHGSEPALTVVQYGDNPVARFIADDGVAFVIEDNGDIGINTSNLEPGVGLTIGTTLSSSYPLSANASHGTFHNFAGSVSEGDSKALGDFAHAEGIASFAYGTGSHAEGASNTANNIASHVEGISNVTSADAAHAEGGNNTASGYAAHAEGSYNTASGNSSHAEGYNNQVTGIASHAHGTGNIVHAPAGSAQGSNNLIEASADNSSAIGVSNTINGINSLAQGENNVIDAAVRNGIAIGKENNIYGTNSVAIGKNNYTLGNESIAIGTGARAGNNKSIVYSATDSNNYQSNSFGDHTFNVFASSGIILYDSTTIGDPTSATFFAITTAGFVGIGTEDPYDMLTVAGNISAQGSLSATAPRGMWHSIGGNLVGGISYHIAPHDKTLVWNTHNNKKFSSTSDNQIALNTEWMVISAKRIELDWDVNIIASGQSPSALNKFNRLSASQLYGTNNYAGGRYGTLTGRHNLVDGDDNIVCGNENTVRGTYNSVIGDHSLAVGKNNVAVLNQSHVEGMNNIVGAPRTITSWTTAANTFYIAGTSFSNLTINFPRENQKIYIHNRGTSRTTNLLRTSFTVLTAFPSQRAIVTVESLSALGFDNPTGDATSGINQGYFIALPTGITSSASNVVAAHAEGLQNLASNTGAHAEGYNNMSLGVASHTEGINTIAGNIASHAEGVSTKSGISIAHISAFDFNARTFYFDNSSPLSASFTPHELWNIVTPGSLIYINDGINISTTTGRKGYTTVVVLSSDPERATITTVSAVNLSFTAVLPNQNVFAYTNGANYTNARGAFTVAGGTYSEACGYSSYALGANSIAQGCRSIAAHNNTYVWADGKNQASGIPVKSTRTDQFVVSAGGGVYFPGNLSLGIDDNSHALTVIGDISGQNPQVAFNRGTAIGTYSFSEGENNYSFGYASHTEGYNTLAAASSGAHAEGAFTTAIGLGTHAQGVNTDALQPASHAEGYNNAAIGFSSHVEGSLNVAGSWLTFTSYDQATKTFTFNPQVSSSLTNNFPEKTLYGYNSISKSYFSAPVTNINLSPCTVTVKTDVIGFDIPIGSMYTGVISDPTCLYNHVEGAGSTAIGYASHAEGDSTTAGANGAHAQGQGSSAYGEASHAEGFFAYAMGPYSHAQGVFTTANGDASHAEGSSTTAIGSISHAEGVGTTAMGSGSHAQGGYTLTVGDYSHAEGYGTVALGNFSHAAGRYVSAAHNRSWAWKGANTTETQVISTTRNNQFMVSAAGGIYFPGYVGIGTDANDQALTVNGTMSGGNIALTQAVKLTPITVTDSGEFLIININGTNKAIRLWDYTT